MCGGILKKKRVGCVYYILTLPNGGLYDGQSRFQQLNRRSRDVVLTVVLHHCDKNLRDGGEIGPANRSISDRNRRRRTRYRVAPHPETIIIYNNNDNNSKRIAIGCRRARDDITSGQ